MLRLPIALTLLLVCASIAGCLSGDDETISPPTLKEPSGGDNNTSLSAPVWEVGQWWGHHTHFGADDAAGSHFNVVVAEASGSGYKVAAQSTTHALLDAEEDVFDLGDFGTDLSTTWGDEAWTWYDWPLEHNKSWSQSVRYEGTEHDLVMTAVEADDLRTAMGDEEGFRIVGTSSDGTILMTYDYVPAMGWFSDLDLFDPEDPETAIFKVRNMGFGENKTGDFYEIDVVDLVGGTYGDDVLGSDSFVVPEGAVQLAGEVLLTVDVGTARLTLDGPDGSTDEYEVALPGGEEAFPVDKEDPAAGDWELSFLGLGDGAEATVSLSAVVRTVLTL